MIFATIAAALILLAGVLLYRTWRFSGLEQPDIDTEIIAIESQSAAERLGTAITYQTVSHQDPGQLNGQQFRELHAYIERMFPLAHEHLQKEVINEYSLLFTWPGADPEAKPIMLTSHLDVVPVEPGTWQNWEHHPFSGTIRDGYIYGRGTMDVQCGVMGILEAVEWLLQNGYKPDRTIYLGFGHDEEVDGDKGAYAISERLKERGIELEYLLDEGLPIVHGLMKEVRNPVALVAVSEKGYMSINLKVKAEGGHSSVPQGKTSIARLSRAIEKLENNPMPARLNGLVQKTFESMAPGIDLSYRFAIANMWLFKGVFQRILAKMPATNAAMRTTTATTIFDAGIKENVLPTQAYAVVNFRIHPDDSIDKVLEHVRKVINDDHVEVELQSGALNPSPVSDIENINYKLLSQSIRQVFTDVTVAPSLMVAATDARHYTDLTPNVYRFLPLRSVESDLDRVHGTNERLSIDNYSEMIRFYIQMLRNTAVSPAEAESRRQFAAEPEQKVTA